MARHMETTMIQNNIILKKTIFYLQFFLNRLDSILNLDFLSDLRTISLMFTSD